MGRIEELQSIAQTSMGFNQKRKTRKAWTVWRVIAKAAIIHGTLMAMQYSTFALLEGTINPRLFTELEKGTIQGTVIGMTILTVLAIALVKFDQVITDAPW